MPKSSKIRKKIKSIIIMNNTNNNQVTFIKVPQFKGPLQKY